MEERPPVVASLPRRKNGDFFIRTAHFDPEGDFTFINEEKVSDGRCAGEIQMTDLFPEKDFVRGSTGIAEAKLVSTGSRQFSRMFSDSSVGFGRVGNPRLKRAFSTTEIKTRLVCPKGLLINTEPPKSGESYRRRSNTDVFPTNNTAARWQGTYIERDNADSSDNSDYRTEYKISSNSLQKEKESILLELESVKHERDELEKENERLHEELENRNKVIDHLIDYMKSIVPYEGQNMEEVDDNSKLSPNGSQTGFSTKV